eukprot:2692700-Prymnesium_polylepis.1
MTHDSLLAGSGCLSNQKRGVVPSRQRPSPASSLVRLWLVWRGFASEERFECPSCPSCLSCLSCLPCASAASRSSVCVFSGAASTPVR